MTTTANPARWRTRAQGYGQQGRTLVRRSLASAARPFLGRLYSRVDHRVVAAIRASHVATDDSLSRLDEQLGLARAATVASSASARELRREHDELRARLADVEARLATLSAAGSAAGAADREQDGSPSVPPPAS